MKVPNPPGSGKDIAKGKGVPGDGESEGSRRQTSDLTNRNHIRLQSRVRLQYKPKPNSCTESVAINMAGIRGKERASTRGGLADVERKVQTTVETRFAARSQMNP